LKDTSRASTESKRRSWTRDSLVVSEIAFACVLLVGAGLLMRSFLRVLDVNLGFHPERAAALRVDPSGQNLTQAQLTAYFDEVLRRARDIPGIGGERDGRASARAQSRLGRLAPRARLHEEDFPIAFVRIVGDRYGRAWGSVDRGRDISDATRHPPNHVLSSRRWRAGTGQDAIGQKVIACNDNGQTSWYCWRCAAYRTGKDAGGSSIPIRQCRD
jgi:hypothetical protein